MAAVNVIFLTVLALAIFLVMNWLGKHSSVFGYTTISMFSEPDEAPAFNFIFRILAPSVCIILVSALVYSIGQDSFTKHIWISVAIYAAGRVLYNVVFDRLSLINRTAFVFQTALAVILAYFADTSLIQKRALLTPDISTAGNELWLLIVVYIYVVLNHIPRSTDAADARRDAYIESRFSDLDNRFSGVIQSITENQAIRALALSVMLVEGFNRPTIVRFFERLLFPIGLAKTLGLMQVRTDRSISDIESVDIGTNLLISLHAETISEIDPGELKAWREQENRHGIQYRESIILHTTLVKYNFSGDYARDIEEIYWLIKRRFFPESTESLLYDVQSS